MNNNVSNLQEIIIFNKYFKKTKAQRHDTV
jgi:hypothetical protein